MMDPRDRTADRIAALFAQGAAVETWNVDPTLNAVEPGSPVGAIWRVRTWDRGEPDRVELGR